jgi:hypothetical protein
MNTKTSSPTMLAIHLFRPVISEAKLMNQKHAHDPIYVATLAEELRSIDRKLAAMEDALHVERTAYLKTEFTSSIAADSDQAAQWIRMKSAELDIRLHRVESLSRRSDLGSPGPPVAPTEASTVRPRWRGSAARVSHYGKRKLTRAS